MTIAQWQSVIRTVGVVFGTILVYAGVTNMTRVGDVVNMLVEQAPTIISAVSALVTTGMAVWGIFSHSNTANINAVKAVSGQGVVVGPTAPTEAQKMAADPLDKKVDFVNTNDRISRHL